MSPASISTTPVSRKTWLWSPDAALVVMAFLLPVLSILGGRMVAQAFIPITLWHILRHLRDLRPLSAFASHPLVWLLGGTFLWGWTSMGWTIAPEASLSTLSRVGSLILGGMMLLYLILRHPPSQQMSQRIQSSLLLGMAVATAFVLSALLFDGGAPAFLNRHFSTGRPFDMFLLKQGNLILAMLTWPVVIILRLRGQKSASHAVLLAMLAVMAFMPSSTAFFSLLGSGAAYFAFLFLSRRMRVVATVAGLGALWLAILLVLPGISVPSLYQDMPWIRPSMIHRMHVWQFTVEKIQERPVLGWGVKSAKSIPDADKTIRGHKTWALLPLHPHNNLLQSWLELGLPGLAIYLGLAGYALSGFYRARFPDKGVEAAGHAALLCALLGGMTGFGLWQSWWVNANMMFAGLLLAILLPALQAQERQS